MSRHPRTSSCWQKSGRQSVAEHQKSVIEFLEFERKEMTTKPQLNNRVRPVRLRTSGATARTLADGAILVRADEALGPYPRVLTDRLVHWTKISPHNICVAKREADGEWREPHIAPAL